MFKAIKLSVCMLAALAFNGTAKATTITDWGVPSYNTIFDNGTVQFGASGGSQLQVSSSLFGGSASTAKFIGFDGVNYDPTAQGAIESFDYSIDQRSLGGAHGWGLGFLQDGAYHLFNMYSQFRFSSTPSNQSSWTTFSDQNVGFDDAWLNPYPNSSAPALDISGTGSLIEVGLIIFSGNGGAASRSDTSQYDNFSISFNQAELPEPASLALLGMGLAGLGVMRRRKNAA